MLLIFAPVHISLFSVGPQLNTSPMLRQESFVTVNGVPYSAAFCSHTSIVTINKYCHAYDGAALNDIYKDTVETTTAMKELGRAFRN